MTRLDTLVQSDLTPTS